MMKIFIIFVFLISVARAADHCFVISGANKEKQDFLKTLKAHQELIKKNSDLLKDNPVPEFKGAFKNHSSLLIDGKAKVGGKSCEIISWDDLNDRMNELKPGSSVLIIQGAHGSKDGKFECDAGDIGGKDVLNRLRLWSENFSLGTVLDSCFSGDLQKLKLKQDLENPKNLDKLCLITSSGIGRVSRAVDNDLLTALQTMKAGSSLEEVFLNSQNGLISSAPWSTVGVDRYFAGKEFSGAMKMFQDMDKIARNSASPCDVIQANSLLCADPRVTDEIYNDLGFIFSPKLKNSDRNDYFAAFVAEDTVNDAYMGMSFPEEVRILFSKRKKCMQQTADFFSKYFDDTLIKANSLTSITDVLQQFKTSPTEFEKCKSYYELRNFLMSKNKLKKVSPAPDDFKNDDYLLYLGFTPLMKESEMREKKIRVLFKYKDEDLDVLKLAQHLYKNPSNQVCSNANKQQIFASTLGEGFFEYDSYPEDQSVGDDGFNRSGNVSPQQMLVAFQKAGLKLKSLEHPLDEKRRKACQNFKL